MQRLVEGTRSNCKVLGASERFDEPLTRRWSARVADAINEADAETFDEFICLHPELRQSDLLGLPAWKVAGLRGESGSALS